MRDAVKHGVTPPPGRYGAGAVTFHWTVAALIVFLGGLGLLFDDIPSAARPFWINVHVCVGLIYFALVIARVLWRTTHKAPDLGPDIGEFSRRTSFAVHHLLYVLMLLIPVVGVVARVWHGRGFDYGVFQLDFGAARTPPYFIRRKRFTNCWPTPYLSSPACTPRGLSTISSSGMTEFYCG